MTAHFNPLATPDPAPLDRFWITTELRIDPNVVGNPSDFRRRSGIPLRRFSPTESYARNERYLSCKLFIQDYYGLVIHIDKRRNQPWTLRKIEANIATLLHGANGRIIDEHELQQGLSLLIDLLTPLLANPQDDIHLVPGLTDHSLSRWQMVEIPFNIFDPDGRIEHIFMNPRHPDIKKPALRGDGESVKLGHKNALMQINFYRKELQMKKILRRFGHEAPARIFRVEVCLKGGKLLQYLGPHGVIRMIREKPQVTSFTGPGLRATHRDVVTRLTGCCQGSLDQIDNPNDNMLGRLMAHVAYRTKLPIEDQISICKERFNISDSTRARYHKAALDEYSKLEPFRIEDIFSPSNYKHQPVVEVPTAERISQERRDYTDIHPLVAAAYGKG